MTRRLGLAAAPILFVTVFVAGCDSSPTSATAPTSTVITSPIALSAEVRAALDRGIQDEYRAETIYQGVVGDFGVIAPFANVLGAEQRHSTSIALMFTRRGLPVPASTWTVATVPHFATVTAACAAGVAAERDNIAMYDQFLALDLPADIRQVFESNRSASLVAHLPAFERCS